MTSDVAKVSDEESNKTKGASVGWRAQLSQAQSFQEPLTEKICATCLKITKWKMQILSHTEISLDLSGTFLDGGAGSPDSHGCHGCRGQSAACKIPSHC